MAGHLRIVGDERPAPPTYIRTAEAARVERLGTWTLIEALGADAADAGLPVTGLASRLAAANALEEAGCDYSSATVRDLAAVAKFDTESTPEQRLTWRRYGWTLLRVVAKSGTSPAEAHELLAGDRLTRAQVVAAVGNGPGTTEPEPEVDLDTAFENWLKRFHGVMCDGAALADRADREAAVLGGFAAMALLLYRRASESQIDAEYRQLTEGAT